MPSWPQGKSIAVAPIVPWEIWPADIGTPDSHQRSAQRPVPKDAWYARDMWAVLDHEYGETHGVRRLLDLFERYDVKATFVANGQRVEKNQDLAKQAASNGHDMGSENYLHTYPILLREPEERESLVQTVQAYQDVLGSAPTGYISPGHRPTPNTIPILLDLGFQWCADFQLEDVPFLLRDGDREMTCMPYAHVSDYHTYATGGRTPRQILEMLIDEFDVLRAEGLRGSPKMMGYVMHPFICHGFRTRIIEEFFEYVQGCPDAWIATRSEIDHWVRTNPELFPVWSLEQVLNLFPAT